MSDLRIKYQTIEFNETDIHVRTLRDRQQYDDPYGRALKLDISSAQWPLFGVIWPAGELLARLMFDYKIEGKRILEVGCGIGLASLVLSHRLADITATDHHPEAEKFLEQNTTLNHLRTIPFVRTGWADSETDLGKFDMIIGSDLLYEDEHADQLAFFVDQHAKRTCHVIIVDPGRCNTARFSKNMVGRGYTYAPIDSTNVDELTQSAKQPKQFQILTYSR